MCFVDNPFIITQEKEKVPEAAVCWVYGHTYVFIKKVQKVNLTCCYCCNTDK